MSPNFHANCISIEKKEFCLQIGFADCEYDTSDYLMFQRGHSFDEQDQRLGMANVYVERNDQVFTITFVASVERHAALSDALRRCFDGFSRFAAHNA